MFHQLGYKDDGSPVNGTIAICQSHHKPTINKCFMTLTTTTYSGTPVTSLESRFLFDAYEQREYAEYSVNSAMENGKLTHGIFTCKLTASAGDERVCKSEGEYDGFVAGYME